ncbi:MarR family transcriptional regulator [Aestuariivirga sp.]|uniref:MarR family winged helix-turn-helix transcriptional regulator n=1 Tax=Aestuariivirga sp. TaxID=2650926 RepID=UPI0025C38B33|nr:MarR family transcriptional regulator [Aestuariivirga sp.]MCA3555107.1 MarR family transcriptional regulator [Aestuariivirga sp.]
MPFRLNVLAQTVSERLSAVYAGKFNLDIPQWRILANLASRGDMTAQEIARVTHGHKSTISRAVRELEDRGLIARKVSSSDRRSFTLTLTGAGRRMFRRLLPLVLDFERNLIAALSDADARSLLKGLTALEAALLRPGGGDK